MAGGRSRQGRPPDALAGIDLTDPDLFAGGRAHDVFTALRRTAPVCRHGAHGGRPFWVLSRYRDIARVYADPATFSSRYGLRLDCVRDRPDPAADRMLEMTDPPRHLRLRRALNQRFSLRAVAALEPGVRLVAREALGEALERVECDFPVVVAGRLPMAVVFALLGVPPADWAGLAELTNRAILTAGAGEVTGGAAARANLEILRYYFGLVAGRRTGRDGDGDLIGLLAGVEIDGERLTDDEVVTTCLNLTIAGSETTRHAVSAGVLALLEHPDELSRLREEPGLARPAVEEVLRWTTPAIHFMRVTTRSAQVGGERLPPGAAVSLWNVSANRDEDVFPEPFRFDVGRSPNPHLAFATGEHFCLGANLARLELRVLLEELVGMVAEIELAGTVRWLRSNFIAGIQHMPVRMAA
jgi:cytochrome P450